MFSWNVGFEMELRWRLLKIHWRFGAEIRISNTILCPNNQIASGDTRGDTEKLAQAHRFTFICERILVLSNFLFRSRDLYVIPFKAALKAHEIAHSCSSYVDKYQSKYGMNYSKTHRSLFYHFILFCFFGEKMRIFQEGEFYKISTQKKREKNEYLY